jgi:chemotaxis protein CheZ
MADQADEIQQVVAATIRDEMGVLRSFFDRRIAELSTEIHATVQLVDFSEINLTGQLTEIRKQIAGVIATPTAATRNSGLELEAVVQATEEAANRIMEAAEAIGDWLREGKNDAEGLRSANEKVNAIFEACSFQDLTGQRIRRAIKHLQQVETMLTDMAPDERGVAPTESRPVVHEPYNGAGAISGGESTANPALGQDAVDSMFDEYRASPQAAVPSEPKSGPVTD